MYTLLYLFKSFYQIKILIMEKREKIIMYFVFLLCILLIFVWIYFIICNSRHYVCFENKCFQVEIAATDESRQQWLMYRESLDENKWMIFVFQNEWILSFWMKNTLIPLDMIWIKNIDWEYRVVDIMVAEPCVTEKCDIYTPAWKAWFVLEINSWLTEKFDIKVWDLVYLDNIVK